MNPYKSFVDSFESLVKQGKNIPMGGIPKSASPTPLPGAPVALIFSPHPDDECIIGALPLRLLREAQYRVINVAVTQGSKKERQAGRLAELEKACDFMGYGLIQTQPGGLEKVSAGTQTNQPELWSRMVAVIRGILESTRPHAIFFPHRADWNSTHIGTHHLVMDALGQIGTSLSCHLIETEFWGQMANPNLMVESSAADVADMVAGTSFHVGEVTRNPFHILLPAWMQDNVRRGSELVGGQGEAAPNYGFATLYRHLLWENGVLKEDFKPTQLPISESPAVLF